MLYKGTWVALFHVTEICCFATEALQWSLYLILLPFATESNILCLFHYFVTEAMQGNLSSILLAFVCRCYTSMVWLLCSLLQRLMELVSYLLTIF